MSTLNLEVIQLQRHGDERGGLIALEENVNVPFSVKRVYYLLETKQGFRRGLHAHRKLTQLLIAVRGNCCLLLDNGYERKEIVLNNPAQGILVRPGIWREIYDFSPDCVLMVLADHLYDKNDYIRDYNDFLIQVRK